MKATHSPTKYDMTPHPFFTAIGNLLLLIATLAAFSALVALTVDTYKAEARIQRIIESR